MQESYFYAFILLTFSNVSHFYIRMRQKHLSKTYSINFSVYMYYSTCTYEGLLYTWMYIVIHWKISLQQNFVKHSYPKLYFKFYDFLEKIITLNFCISLSSQRIPNYQKASVISVCDTICMN